MKKFYLDGLDNIPDEVVAKFSTTRTVFSRIIWDISTVGYIMNPNWCATKLMPSPILNDDMSWVRDAARACRLCHADGKPSRLSFDELQFSRRWKPPAG